MKESMPLLVGFNERRQGRHAVVQPPTAMDQCVSYLAIVTPHRIAQQRRENDVLQACFMRGLMKTSSGAEMSSLLADVRTLKNWML